MYYVSADENFQVCTQNGWEIIDITGPFGADGTNGVDGQNGADGINGAEFRRCAQDGVDGNTFDVSWLDYSDGHSMPCQDISGQNFSGFSGLAVDIRLFLF